jgi:outer membrane protein insertion porin family
MKAVTYKFINSVIVMMGLFCIIYLIMPVSAQESSPNPFIIKSIDVQGSKTMPPETIIAILQTRVGEEISIRKIREDVKELYKLGQFSNIKVDSTSIDDGIKITFIVEEWPKISGDIAINGNKEISTGKIRDILTIGTNRSLSGKARQDNKNKILNYYRQKGFYLAEVEPNIIANPEDGTARVAFDITEGRKISVEEIQITGNRRISDREIRKQMKLKKGKRFDDIYYEGDIKAIPEYYRQNGFIDAKVIKAEKEFNEAKTGIKINIEVEEGPQYRVGDINVTIIPYADSKPIYSKKDILKQFTLKEGDLFKEMSFVEGLGLIRKMYLDKGRVSIQIKPDIDYKKGEETVNIGLTISEGTIAYIASVPINWISETSDEPHKTKEYVIRRELERYDIREGEIYSSQNVEDARRKILNLGPFIKRVEPQINLETERIDEPIKTDIDKNDDSQRINVGFDIQESRQSGMFSIAGGYGSEGGLFGALDIWDDNILGRALRLQLRGEIGTKERRTGQIVFSSPWLLNTPTSINASLYSIRRSLYYMPGEYNDQKNKSGSYRDDSVGGSITLGRPIIRNMDVALRLRNENTRYKQWDEKQNMYVTPQEWYKSNINPDPSPTDLASLPLSEGKTRSIGLIMDRDTRNYMTSMFDPNGGSYNNISAEISGLGGDRFQKFQSESSLFIPTWWKLVLVFHLKTGYITGKDAKYLRFERFYLGGIQSIRGYPLYSITPPGEYSQYGGNRMGQLNIEYRFPITNMLRGIIFFDAGQTWGGNEKIFSDFSPKKSIGVGLRFDFLGALARVEYGYRLDTIGTTKKGGRLEFDLGPAF